MIQVLDQYDIELYRYKLIQGENKVGSDAKHCNFVFRGVQGVLLSIGYFDNDIFLTHFSNSEPVFKESTLKPYTKVPIPKQFPIELIPNKIYYFSQYKFKLLEDYSKEEFKSKEQIQTTQLIEDFAGTMQLDDILECQPIVQPRITTTQQFSTTQILTSQEPCNSTQIIEDIDPLLNNQSTPVNSTLEQYISQFTTQNHTSNLKIEGYYTYQLNQYTQTDESWIQNGIQQNKPSLFQNVFLGAQKQQQQNKSTLQSQIQKQQETHLGLTLQNSQIDATIQDQDQDNLFQKKEIKGTIIDEDLDKAFSSQNINSFKISDSDKKSQQQDQQQQQQSYRRINSIQSEENQLKKQDVGLNDIFGSLPDPIPQFQPIPVKKMTYTNIFQRTQNNQEIQDNSQHNTPLKEQKEQKEQNKKKGKVKKIQKKKGGVLKKATDEISDYSSSSNDEQEVQQKQNVQEIRHTNSIELPSKINEEFPTNNIPKKRRGLRKQKQNQTKEFHFIAFSGFQQNDMPSQAELNGLDLELVTNQYNKFDILIVQNPPKRTFKFLVALMLGAEIVTMDWLKDSIYHKEQMNYFNYIPDSGEFANQFGSSIKQIIENRDEYFESNDNIVSIFENKYYVGNDVIPSKEEIEYLIGLGGGQIVSKITKQVIVVSENKMKNGISSDAILDACMF